MRYPTSRIRFALLAVLVVAATCFVVASNGASAAPPAKLGATYAKVNAATPTNSVYTRVVELSLPAGKYLVSGKGQVLNQLANSGVATLSAAGVLWVECISSPDPGAATSARITAPTMAHVIVLP